MYGVVLMVAMTGGADVPASHFGSSCYGSSCYGSSCYGSSCTGGGHKHKLFGGGGCTGGHKMFGGHKSHGCSGSSCHGTTYVSSCYGGCTGSCTGGKHKHKLFGGHKSHGCSGSCYGSSCYGSSCYGSSCYGSSCYGGGVISGSCYGGTIVGGPVVGGPVVGGPVGPVEGPGVDPKVTPKVDPKVTPKDEAPLTPAELKKWTDYVAQLEGKDKKVAEGEWAKATTNRAKRALIRLIPKDDEIAAPATLIVNLPATAELTIQGTATTLTSAQRVFVSPTLEAGKNYVYTLEAKVVEGGRTITVTKAVNVKAGQTSEVSLTVPVATTNVALGN